MHTVELIRKKRNGGELTAAEIDFLVTGYTKGKIPDYQFSAFLMAAYLKGMVPTETAALTKSMLYSGKVVDLSSIRGFKVDKHSTGGVGDKTSLILAPIVAAAGIPVPMISGRGLGHTGGTLDKLEAIPGFRTSLTLAAYKRVLAKHRAVMIGQTKEIAPADKLIYSLRDVTATVESIPLITGSIMSKKLAEGINGLVLDVKTGSGAFMKKYEDSVALAESLMNTAKAFRKKVIAFITDMSQPLGTHIGNWHEVLEATSVLLGEPVPDLCKVSFTLSGAMIYLAGKAGSVEEGYAISEELVHSGRALHAWYGMVKAQGGDTRVLMDPALYPKARYSQGVTAPKSGYLNETDTFEIGMAALQLGAGRLRKEDAINPKAGIIFRKKLGEPVSKGETIAELFTDNGKALDGAAARVLQAVEIDALRKRPPVLIRKRLE